ncbi:MAG TPA: PatB family C-S lyase [Longilinea sp.]|nr:PatB family C-S lyase [Longilinea sp.]
MADFDHFPERRSTESVKWRIFDEDVLPMWVADMDFRSPEPVIQALHARVEHGIFGYPLPQDEFRQVVVERLANRYQWQVCPDDLIFLPGVVTGFNLVCQALTQTGQAAIIQTPVYFPFLSAPENAGLTRQENQLVMASDGRYEIDFDDFERQITPQTKMFILCNPHNPVGRVFTRPELERLAEICLRHDIYICSDEIHSDLIFSGYQHTPIATLGKQVSDRTVTLIAPSKTFNIAGLECSIAVVTNPKLRKRIEAARKGLVHGVNVLGLTAGLAAYKYGEGWLNELLVYLEGNRDFLSDFVMERLPGVRMSPMEGTYLAWLDCRGSNVADSACKSFLEKGRVALNNGADFGKGGEGFVRLNFGCPRSMLKDALERMEKVLEQKNE